MNVLRASSSISVPDWHRLSLHFNCPAPFTTSVDLSHVLESQPRGHPTRSKSPISPTVAFDTAIRSLKADVAELRPRETPFLLHPIQSGAPAWRKSEEYLPRETPVTSSVLSVQPTVID